MQDGDRRTVQFGTKGKRLRVEVSASTGALRQGLMFRDILPEGSGMFFAFPKPSIYSMWMMNMQIPLDIVWLDKDMKVVTVQTAVPPCPNQDACPSYSSREEAMQAIEMGANTAAVQGATLGAKLRFI